MKFNQCWFSLSSIVKRLFYFSDLMLLIITNAFFSSDHFFFSSWLKFIACKALVFDVCRISCSRHLDSSSLWRFSFSWSRCLKISPAWTPASPLSSSIYWWSDVTLSQTLFLNWGIRFRLVIVSFISFLKDGSPSSTARFCFGDNPVVLKLAFEVSAVPGYKRWTEELYVWRSLLTPSSYVGSK